MTRRWAFLVAGLFLLVASCWVATSARSQQQPNQAEKEKKKNANKQKAELASAGTPVLVDEQQWPADNTITLRIEFGLHDREPTNWDGRIEATGAQIIRIRPWRFGSEMAINSNTRSWQCGTWLGPVPAERPFDGHLPARPRPFVRPGLLIDLPSDSAERAELTVDTPRGKFSFAVAKLDAGHITALDGSVAVDRSVFGYPVGARQQANQHLWYDDPALAIKSGSPDEVAVSYLAYSHETTSDAIYVRCRVGNKWQEPELISDAKGDHYRSAVGFDSAGNLWVVYSAQIDGNWDLYARQQRDGLWQPAERLTRNARPDIQHVLIADRSKNLWLVWQGFRNGQSDVLTRRWNGVSWSDEQQISTAKANDWHPSATALPAGGIAVAWDSYESGNYDVLCRSTDVTGKSWGPVLQVTASQALEARPSIAADQAGRLWIAYDTAGAFWGKDTGYMLELAQAPQGTRLYEGRGISVSIVDAATKRILAPPEPRVLFDSLNSTIFEQLEYPQLVCDPAGRMWLVMRRRAMLSNSRRGVGRMFAHEVLVSRFDSATGRWTNPILATDSAGRQDSVSGLDVGASGMWLAWSNDHRGLAVNRPDATSIFAGRLAFDKLPVDDVASVKFTPAPHSSATPAPPPAHPNEAADVARLRNYTIEAGGNKYRIYRGDMHRHTETSSDGGGDGSMLDVYRYAIDAAAMDFLLVTDHHDGNRAYDWWRREKFNDLFRIGESFTGLFGYERSVSYPNGHRNVFFAKRGNQPLANLPQEQGREPTGTGQFLYPHLRERGGICFSHTSATGMGTDWRDNDPELEPLVEIFQGDRTNYEKLGAPWSADANNPATQEGGFQPLGYVNLALAKGYKLGFQSSSDHLSTHLSYSCILAERDTREALMDAMKKRHAYAATDNILLDVRGRSDNGEHIMGDVFTCTAWPKLQIKVIGTGKLAEIVVVKNDRVAYSTQPTGNESSFEFTDTDAEKGRESYYYIRVLQTDRRLAWSSPMWITSK